MAKDNDFSDTNAAGRKYVKKPEKRRTPSKPKQVARGIGFPQHAARMAESARKAMKRGRHSAPGDDS